MLFPIVLITAILYVLIIDYVYLSKEHKFAMIIEFIVLIATTSFILFLYYYNPRFYGHLNSGRKIDLMLLMWVTRELIHSRVRNNEQNKIITDLIRNMAVERTQTIKLNQDQAHSRNDNPDIQI